MKTFSITDIGRLRETNQDYVYTSDTPVGVLPNLFLVADGMGGHNAGDYASKYTVETVVSLLQELPGEDPEVLLSDAIEETNRRLISQAVNDPALFGMGTTLVALVIDGEKALIANVGDSRLYVINGSEIQQITEDHSDVQEMVKIGEMDAQEARISPEKNIITRAIGAEPNVQIDFFERELRKGDEILMCTDGLTNMVDDEDIRRIVIGQRDIVEKTMKLVQSANENGGRDNISVVLVEPFAD